MDTKLLICFIEIFIFLVLFLIYAIRYQLFPYWFAKLCKNQTKADRIIRVQIRKKLGKGQIHEYKYLRTWTNLLNKSGITSHIPGLTVEKATLCYFIIGLILGFNLWIYCGPIMMVVITLLYFGLSVNFLYYLGYKRHIDMENLLIDFITEISTNTLQTDNLISLFGNIYMKFPPILSNAMMECYVEQSITKDDNKAIEHLKEKYDSFIFAFILDNLALCKKEGMDLGKVCKDLQETLSPYLVEQTENYVLEQKIKSSIIFHFIVFIVLFFGLGFFLDGPFTIMKMTYGVYILILAILTFVYGMIGGKK